MNIINSNQKTTNLNSKMTSKLIYDVKGKVNKVEKSFYEMSDENLSKILIFSKPIVKAIEKTIDCLRVGSLIAGLEVPHAHLHLVPIFSMQTFSFEFAKEASREELEQIQKQILAHL